MSLPFGMLFSALEQDHVASADLRSDSVVAQDPPASGEDDEQLAKARLVPANCAAGFEPKPVCVGLAVADREANG